MAWRTVILAALGLLLLIGSPAAAGIDKTVDIRGVLVIRNTGAKAAAPQADSETQVQVPPEAQPEAPAETPAAPVETPVVQAATNPADAPPAVNSRQLPGPGGRSPRSSAESRRVHPV
jgi:hypothetical protein